ncbi:MAG: hypothetical protein AAGG81_05735, partial [Chlamydiota bacterium]
MKKHPTAKELIGKAKNVFKKIKDPLSILACFLHLGDKVFLAGGIMSITPPFDIPATISGNIIPDRIPENIKNRINELGLSEILEKPDGVKQLEILERSVWSLAPKVKKRLLKTENKDIINCLNYLESFCLYSCQYNINRFANKGKLQELRAKELLDKNVYKAVQEIETIRKLLGSGMKKNGKEALKEHIEILNKLVGKVLVNNLNQTEQIAMGKTV